MRSRPIRALFVTFGAAILGALGGSLAALFLLPHNPEIPVGVGAVPTLAMFVFPFTLVGTTILGVIHVALADRAYEPARTAILLVSGAIFGALMLTGFISLLHAPGGFYVFTVVVIGTGFGLVTTLCWVTLERLTRNRIV